MRCSKCGAENPDRAKFCVECASPFARRCPSCNAENPPNAKFCLECARPIEVAGGKSQRVLDAGSPIQVNAETADSLEGERKTVTALFADIKGSMELIEDLDPEEARAIVDPALKLMIEAVHHYGGYVAQSTGDGIFALFGAPVAHEDHPQRALYAALRMQEDLKRYSDRIRTEGRLPIQARVGVNTGEVVVRSITTGEGRTEYTPVGHSTGIAARMQALAPVGSIAVTEPVRKLCEGYFVLKSLGPTNVKGVSEPVTVYEVTGPGPFRTRLQRSAIRGYTRFVGREREMETMRHAAELAKSGHGQIVAAVAEPGFGKSRLFHEFKLISKSDCIVLEAFSVSLSNSSAYLPVIDLLNNYFGITVEDDEFKRRAKITGSVLALDRRLEETLPYLFSLLGVSDPDSSLQQIDPQIRRRRTLEALKRLLLRRSLEQPVLIFFEDLHWIDSETQAFLDLLAESIASACVLLLVNYRPEYQHGWGSRTYYTQLRLDALGKDKASEMLTALTGDNPELAPLRRIVIDRTEGNPLFIEEIVLALFEDGSLTRNGTVKLTRPIAAIGLPPAVKGIVAARIDRLEPEAKELLQTLAVIGTKIPLGLVKRVVPRSDEDLQRLLSRLQLGEYIYERPAFPDVEYTFKHALTQDVAYQSVLIERRKRIHECVAAAMEELFSETLTDHYADLAHHYRMSNNTAKAVQYLWLAGKQAAARSGFNEALQDLAEGLDRVKSLPESRERDKNELAYRIALSECHSATKGFAAPEVETALRRAQELCNPAEDGVSLFLVLEGLRRLHMFRLEMETARALALEQFAVAQRLNDPKILARGHAALGITLLWLGEAVSADDHLSKATRLFEARFQNDDYRIVALSYYSLALWIVGWPEKAVSVSSESLSLGQLLRHSPWMSLALDLAWEVNRLLGDRRMAKKLAEQELSLASESGSRFLLTYGTFHDGFSSVEDGRIEEGISKMRSAVAAFKAAGVAATNWLMAAMGESYLKTERPTEGLTILETALNLTERSADRLFEAELRRLKGELVLSHDQAAGARAEACFREAITVARLQGAKSWELRATASLARFLRDTGRTGEARTVLADIYNWFTEGFDTADLKDAKALLGELSA